VRQELAYLGLRHLPGVALVVKKNEAANPIGVAPFGSQTVVFSSDHVPDLIEQFGIARRGRGV
jgi:hypothetical protein